MGLKISSKKHFPSVSSAKKQDRRPGLRRSWPYDAQNERTDSASAIEPAEAPALNLGASNSAENLSFVDFATLEIGSSDIDPQINPGLECCSVYDVGVEVTEQVRFPDIHRVASADQADEQQESTAANVTSAGDEAMIQQPRVELNVANSASTNSAINSVMSKQRRLDIQTQASQRDQSEASRREPKVNLPKGVVNQSSSLLRNDDAHLAMPATTGGDTTVSKRAKLSEATSRKEIQQTQFLKFEDAKAAWEVDRFHWPQITSRLIREEPQAFDELYHSLERVEGRPFRCLPVTSLEPGGGCTTLAISISRWAAAAGFSTLLIDGNVENSQIAKLSGLEIDFSWQDAVENGQPVGESMVHCETSSLSVLPLNGRKAIEMPSKKMSLCVAELVRKASRLFDLTIVDMGVVSDLENRQSQISLEVDMTLLVRNANMPSSSQMLDARLQLDSIGFSNVVVAENFGHRIAS